MQGNQDSLLLPADTLALDLRSEWTYEESGLLLHQSDRTPLLTV